MSSPDASTSASATAAAPACAPALSALLDLRWLDWHGLPADCSPAALDALLGGSTVLDAEDALGSEGTRCTRSSLNDAPLLVWHRGEQVLLVELDLLGAPAAAPPAAALARLAIDRLDVAWGASTLKGGEWVIGERGLALIVTSRQRVVGAVGFAPMSTERYVATLRPRRGRSVLPPRSRVPRRAQKGGGS